ncbi:general transcription factor II-I repeat domain-containing protein 2B-like [Triplophysa rosa]|nr:general transcription factor II-I repeat domain-containing protein 2B-like [Triplophysa rosa]
MKRLLLILQPGEGACFCRSLINRSRRCALLRTFTKMSKKKRKIDSENRAFQARWETDYLFTEFKGEPMCLVCLETKSVMKDFNLNRHYATAHKEKYERYTGDARTALISDLKGKIHRQQNLFTKCMTVQESSLKASYAVSLVLAKAKKSLSECETVKQCAIEMAKAFGDEKMAKNFESVSLSRRTVTRRISDIQCQIQEKLKQEIENCKYFSLALDESTDVTDVSQLLIFARTITEKFDVHEELLKLVSLHGTTKGEDIFKSVEIAVNEHGGFAKLSAVVTDGAPAMQGKKSGFAGLLKKNGVNCPVLHCIIHQEALCAKILDFSHVMNVVTKVTNLIRGGNRALNHRKFTAFLDEVSATYGDLLMHTDIRWMSRGKCLERFFALRTEVPVFLEDSIKSDTSAYCSNLRDPEFLCDLAFLTDMTAHLNNLNTQLQGRSQAVSDLYGHLTAFKRKLILFHDGFSSDPVNLTHFSACEEMRKDTPECEMFFAKYKKDIESLQEQFRIRFQDFHAMQHRIDLFADPLNAAVSEQPGEMQLELCELQSDPFFQARRNERGLEFWKLLPESRFPLLRDFALFMLSMFGSTYICESSFSTMKHIKSKDRNRLTDDHLFQLLQVGCTNFQIDIDSIVHQQEKPQVSH